MASKWRPLSTREMVGHNSRRRRMGSLDPTLGLFRTHTFDVDATGIATGDVFPDRNQPFTIATKVKITGAAPAGIICELGSATTGLALWIDAAGDKLHFACGDAAASTGITITGPEVINGQTLNIVAAVIPKNGQVRLWVNGHLVASGQATSYSLPNGWSDIGDGAVADVDTNVTTRVAVGDRIALADASIISPVSCYHNQRPRQFYEVDGSAVSMDLTVTATGNLTPKFTFGSGTIDVFINGTYDSSLTSGVEATIAVTNGDAISYRCSEWDEITLIDCHSDKISGAFPSANWPSGLTTLRLYDTSVDGDVGSANWPSGLTTLNLSSTSVDGDVGSANWPSGLVTLYLGSTSVDGDVGSANWPSGLTTLRLYNTSVDGDVGSANWPSGLTTLYLYNTSVGYGTGENFDDITSSLVKIDLDGCSLTETEVDAVLKDCVDSGVSGKTLDLAGSNASPSATGETNKTTLVADGWTVTTTAP